jgi:hypothetical protein
MLKLKDGVSSAVIHPFGLTLRSGQTLIIRKANEASILRGNTAIRLTGACELELTGSYRVYQGVPEYIAASDTPDEVELPKENKSMAGRKKARKKG